MFKFDLEMFFPNDPAKFGAQAGTSFVFGTSVDRKYAAESLRAAKVLRTKSPVTVKVSVAKQPSKTASTFEREFYGKQAWKRVAKKGCTIRGRRLLDLLAVYGPEPYYHSYCE